MSLNPFKSSGGGSQSISVKMPKWLEEIHRPIYTEMGAIGQKIANQPYKAYSGDRVANMPQSMKNNLLKMGKAGKSSIFGEAINFGRNMANNGMAGVAGVDALKYQLNDPNYQKAKGYTGDVLSGKYINSNPYLEGIVDKSKRGVTDTFNKTMLPQQQANLARAGAFGGSGWNQANQDMYGELSQALSDAEMGTRYQDYGVERGYMDKAVSDAMNQQGMEYQTALGNQASLESKYGRDIAERDAQQAAKERGINLGLSTDAQRLQALQSAIGAGDYRRGVRQQELDADYGDFTEERDWLFRALQGLQGGIGNSSSLYGQKGKGGGGGNTLGQLGQFAGGLGSLFTGWGGL